VASESKKTVVIAIAANLTLALAKLGAGLLSGSKALLAEAAHSIADTTDQVFLLVSLRLGDRPADEEHPFGYGKERFFWAFLAAVVIFVSGGVFSIAQGVMGLLGGAEKEDSSGIIANFIVIGIGFLAEGTSWYRSYRQIRNEARENDTEFRKFVKESKDPTVKTVLLEDSAAIVGLTLAAIGVGMDGLTGQPYWDAGASIAIGLLLGYVGIGLGRYTKGLLLGEAANPGDREKLVEAIEAHDEVEDIEELLTMAVGPESLLVAVRLDLKDGIDADQIERLSSDLRKELPKVVPSVTNVFLDASPGHDDSTESDGKHQGVPSGTGTGSRPAEPR
jgi:cation diffusion facilitator family transporter